MPPVIVYDVRLISYNYARFSLISITTRDRFVFRKTDHRNANEQRGCTRRLHYCTISSRRNFGLITARVDNVFQPRFYVYEESVNDDLAR